MNRLIRGLRVDGKPHNAIVAKDIRQVKKSVIVSIQTT